MKSTRRPVLVLAFEEGHLTAVLRNGKGQALTAPLAVDPLADDPPLVAQELRDRLAPLGHLPRRAVVGLSLQRLPLTGVTIPELPEEAVAGYLALQAEREFLLPPHEIALGISRYRLPDGPPGAILAGLPVNQYRNLQRSLRLIGIRRLEVMPLAAAALGDGDGACLLVSTRGIDLAVSVGGGIVLLRRLASTAADSQRPEPDYAALPGELRISLRQLPAGVRSSLGAIRVIGRSAEVGRAIDELSGVPGLGDWTFSSAATEEGATSYCCVIAAERAAARLAVPLSLTPVTAPVSRTGWFGISRRHLTIGLAAVLAVVLGLVGIGVWQQRELTRLRLEWSALEPRVSAVQAIVAEAKARDPWLSDDPVSLELLRAVTLAFPERGTVWTTRVEIKDRHLVSLAGKAADRDAWLSTHAALSETPGVENLRAPLTREDGDRKSPLAFAMTFTWNAPRVARQEVTP